MNFYRFNRHAQRDAVEWDEVGPEFHSTRCPVNPEDHLNMVRIGTFRVVLPRQKVPDITKTWYSEFLLQDHVVEIFEKAGLTGYSLGPVEARFKRGEWGAPPHLQELKVHGFGGIASPRSGVHVVEERCEACGYMAWTHYTQAEYLIDETQWDGSDFFMVWPYPNLVFVTERVKEVLRAHKLKGADCLPLATMNENLWSNLLRASRLSNNLPQPKAHEMAVKFNLPE